MSAPPDWPAGHGRLLIDRTDSTNLEAARLLEAGHAAPFWVMAAEQTAGRGRRGRAWVPGRGNFYATLLCRPALPRADWPLLSFAASLALADAVRAVAPGAEPSLKWPNDVLLAGGKLAGILLETGPMRDGIEHLRIGIGINLASSPGVEAAAYSPTALAAHGHPTTAPETMLSHLAPSVAHWAARLEAEGFAPLRAAWMAGAHGMGDVATVAGGAAPLTGRFRGLGPDGALLLDTADGPKSLHAGDVIFPKEQAHAFGH